jgi:alpha-glucosidase (family GH31 glycosyl hydrolase)
MIRWDRWMMRLWMWIGIGWLGGSWLNVSAQVLTVDPPNPTPEDDVVIVFDASEGNQALLDYQGPIYAHTGLITGTPERPSDWRFIQGAWGQADNKVRMRYLGNHRYQLRFQVRDFYGLPAGEDFLQMAFVFRDRSGERVARNADETDLYYPQLRTTQAPPAPLLTLANAQSMGALQSVQRLADSSLLLSDGQQALRIRAFGPGILNLAYLPTGASDLPPSISVIATPNALPVDSLADSLMVFPLGEGFAVRLHGQPLRWALYQGDSLLLDDEQGFGYDPNSRSSGLRLHLSPQERIYGLGSRALPLDRRGYRLDIYHRPNEGYQNGSQDLSLSLPYLQSSRGYSLLIDNYRRGYVDVGKTESDILEIGMTDTVLSCYLLVGKPPQLVEALTQLTGRQPMPPRWALGYLQSRYSYQSQQQAEEITLLTGEAGFPLDGVMLGLDWFGGMQQMGTLRWAKGLWPDPAGMIQRFDALGIKVVPIIEPYVIRDLPTFDSLAQEGLLATQANGKPYVMDEFWAGPAGLLDIFRPAAAPWLWQHLLPILDLGVGGLWSDLVEPELHPDDLRHVNGWAPSVHNAYAQHWMAELYREQRRYFPQQRWFHLIRSGFTGMQRYGAFPSSGVVSRSWAGLQGQPGALLGAGLCGVGYLHSDLGGSVGKQPDEHLYQRWLQMGVFSPLMRVHGNVNESVSPEPIFHSPESQDRVRSAIELRYRLMPYLYTLAWENHVHGWPLARPLFFHYPQDPNVDRLHEAYLWGRDLLVAPVLAPQASSQELYLPAGRWYDFFTGEACAGRQWVSVAVVEDHLPTFARGGSLIPLAEPAPSLAAQRLDTLTLRWYLAGQDGRYASSLYWDDGQTPAAYERGAYQLMTFGWEEANQQVMLTIQTEGATFLSVAGMPRATVELYGLSDPPRRLKVGKQALKAEDWRWDAAQRCLRFTVPRLRDQLTIKLKR